MTLTQAKKKCWEEFSKYIRLRDCLKTTGRTTEGKCYTCGRIYPFKSLQGGHFIPGRHNSILFSEDQVHAQCYHCNIGLKGAWPEYYKNMVRDFGEERVKEMIFKEKEVKQFKIFGLEELRREILQKTKNLQ